MKLMNFRPFHPVFTEAGKVGLSRGGKTEEEIWREFAHDPTRCHAVAETIRSTLDSIPEKETTTDGIDGDIEEAEEGRVITALHRRYERDKSIVQKAKKRMLAASGHLACEACGFDFRERYGEHGKGFIECHHARPVHTIRAGEKTKISDLRLVCANCHRMIHARRQWLSMDELIAILKRPGAAASKQVG